MAPVQEHNTTKDTSESKTTAFPDWLNEDFFAEILNKEFGKIEITNFNVKPALSKGENYASAMNRVQIEIKLKDDTLKTVSYIVKSTVQTELAHQFLAEMSVFIKEIDMYDQIVPKMEAMYRELDVEVNIGAKCAKTQQTPPIIVLEDLKVKNYANIDRLKGMDLKHAEATLAKLAQFHAASARLYERQGPYADHFFKSIFPPEMEEYMTILFDSFWPIIEESIRQWGDCEKYIKKIKTSNTKMFQLFQAAEKVDPTDFNVLNHGDMWANNVMFEHNDDGSIKDVKFVDLQICTWGSPVRDLQYFIMSSCQKDIRIEKFHYLVKYYYDQLISNLKLVKYSGKLPTLLELQCQLLKRGYFSFNTAFGVLAIVLLDPSEDASMENFLVQSEKGDEFRRKVFTNPRYMEAMKTIIPFLDNRGILDSE